MKRYIIDISRCKDCPNFEMPSNDKVALAYCFKVGRLTNNWGDKIPWWCPLPNSKDK